MNAINPNIERAKNDILNFLKNIGHDSPEDNGNFIEGLFGTIEMLNNKNAEIYEMLEKSLLIIDGNPHLSKLERTELDYIKRLLKDDLYKTYTSLFSSLHGLKISTGGNFMVLLDNLLYAIAGVENE